MINNSKSILAYGACISLIGILLSGCKPEALTEADLFKSADPGTIAELTADGTLYDLDDFVDKFMYKTDPVSGKQTEKGDYDLDGHGYRTRGHADGSDAYYFSIDNIPTDGPGVYIRGRIVTDDYGGNYYKSLVIQQLKVNPPAPGSSTPDTVQQTLRLSVDMGSVSGLYQYGQEILIRCNGLAIGRYANQPQLCVPTYNNNVYADKANQKVGWAPGRIPASRFNEAVTLLGTPDKSKVYYEPISGMAQLKTKYLTKYMNGTFVDTKKVRHLDAHLIRLTGIHFTGHCTNSSMQTVMCRIWNPASDSIQWGDPEEDGQTNVFGPTTGNVGNPQSRFITDGTKDSIKVSTSEYAKYSHFFLPSVITTKDTTVIKKDGTNVDYTIHRFNYAKVEGAVRGIIGYYIDNAAYDPEVSNWAITPCNITDYEMYVTDGKGNRQKDTDGKDIPWQPVEFSKSRFNVRIY